MTIFSQVKSASQIRMTIAQTRRLLGWIVQQQDYELLGKDPEELVNILSKSHPERKLCKDKNELNLFMIYLRKDISFCPVSDFELTQYEIGYIRWLIAKEVELNLTNVDRKLLCKQFVRSWGILYGYKKQQILSGQAIHHCADDDILAEIDAETRYNSKLFGEIKAAIQASLSATSKEFETINQMATRSVAEKRKIQQTPSVCKKLKSEEPQEELSESDKNKLLLEMRGFNQLLIRLRSL